jgi:hypothetical protein
MPLELDSRNGPILCGAERFSAHEPLKGTTNVDFTSNSRRVSLIDRQHDHVHRPRRRGIARRAASNREGRAQREPSPLLARKRLVFGKSAVRLACSQRTDSRRAGRQSVDRAILWLGLVSSRTCSLLRSAACAVLSRRSGSGDLGQVLARVHDARRARITAFILRRTLVSCQLLNRRQLQC